MTAVSPTCMSQVHIFLGWKKVQCSEVLTCFSSQISSCISSVQSTHWWCGEYFLSCVKYFITSFAPNVLCTFLQKLGDRLGDLGEVRNTPPIIARQSRETTYLMHYLWRLPLQHISYLARVHHDFFWRYHVTQESHFTQPKLALAELDVQLVLSQSLKHDTKVFLMFFHTLRVYQNIVDENHDKLIQLQHEHRVHEVHEVCRCVA
jgi:hypothetical protein